MIRGLNKITKASGLGYLMSSYTSHHDMTLAEQEAKEIAARFIQSGLVVFAPIAYGPGIEPNITGLFGEADEKYIKSHEFWMPICERFFERCDYGIIAMTSGWHKSTGIAIELYALSFTGVPVWFYDVANDHVLTFGEVGERYELELEELLKRSKELQLSHLNMNAEIENEAVGLAIA